ncbi:MAG: V-type ATP synthase subunit E [gamma proteobacterium symbiont of Taylorina sp.]|nr:V-type ATP synthase subunit E [gamma proteobacterium symbiont of Taylorina sp.]
MSSDLKVEDLEKALMQRADDLAEEYLQRARRSHDHFISDENVRLQLREEKEVMAAKMSAESIYRSRVQSSELMVQKKLDQLRWQLIKAVIDQVKDKTRHIVKDKDRYTQLIIKFIRHSANKINQKNLIVELNENDYQLIAPQWERIIEQLGSESPQPINSPAKKAVDEFMFDKSIELSKQFHRMSGGIIVYNQTRSIRINNTFEGRLERLSDNIHQLVAEHFFSELSHESDKIHGR